MKKYIVLENWAFGVNYYDASGLVHPDYEIEKTGQPITTMTKSQAENIAQRNYYYQIKEI
jgi:hypothetical protein